MKDVFHLVPTSYDDEGFPVWSTSLTPSENTKRALVLALPDQVIPVIFVPGIMGSNLKLINAVNDKAAGDIAWRPDSAGLSQARMSAASRQQILDAKNTVVDTRVTVGKNHWVNPVSGMSLKAAESRGWGSVFWQSYGGVLTYLDSALNSPCFYDPTTDRVLISALFKGLVDTGIAVPGTPAIKLESSDLEHMSEYWFPVHAVGYNWLQSNEDAGKYLAGEIRRIKALYQKKLNRADACQKVIMITHSMGGLVTRAAVDPKMGGAAADVLGVVHGVMPAIGAAAAYKRMRTGFERGDIDWFSLGSIKGELGGQAVAGNNGRDVTAVLAHAPGGLQLLPNKVYQPEGWLKVAGVESQPYTVPMNGNPYASIYREQKKWWRLITPEWLDPAGVFEKPKKPMTAWTSFSAALQTAEDFHDDLGANYHPNTYVFFGSDKKNHPSYSTVTWEKAGTMNQDIGQLFTKASSNVEIMKSGLAYRPDDDATGYVWAKSSNGLLNFSMTKPVEAGDGTVPEISGAAPYRFAASGSVRTQVGIGGIDHQGAYNTDHDSVTAFVLYSVCKIAKDAP